MLNGKGLVIMVMLTAIMIMFSGCDTEQEKSSGVNIVIDNGLAVNLLASNMTPFKGEKKEAGVLDSAKTKVNNDSFDFSSLSYSDDTVNVGDVIYVEGVIPEEDYPADKIYVYSEPEDKVSFENVYLTNKDGDTVLTFDVVGEEVGNATVYVGLDDSEYGGPPVHQG